ncbi:MAG TPA: aldehyde dehydrogenase family protein [Anaerolineae bacterium]|nr:aldehyde dehydrogenase family protein [Anaerolineae bacterium]
MTDINWNWIQSEPYEMFIGGEFTRGSTGRTYDIINPANNETIARAWEASLDDVDRAVAAARDAFDNGPWSRMTGKERGEYLRRMADLIRGDMNKFAFLEAADVGKTFHRTLSYSIPQAIDGFEYHAGKAREIAGEVRPVPERNFFNYRVWEPMGVVAEILPWNGPFMMACQKVSAILAAGNTVVIKPSQEGSLSNLELAKLFARAEFPPGVVNVVAGPGHALGARLVEHPDVDMISLTGGTDTGKAVMRQAADTMKKVALELGGKNPHIVFDDADVEQAVQWAIYAAFADQGQICVSGSRLLLHDPIYEDFMDAFVDRVRQLKIGDTMAEDTDIGPVISRRHEQTILNYLNIGKQEGATLLLGGEKVHDAPFDRGNYIQPTIFTDVTPDMRIAQEEIFGPVVTVTRFHDDDEALRISNGIKYGLAGGIWTRDIDRALRTASRLNAGQIYLNSYYSPALVDSPAEGHKESGIGGTGVYKYMQEKTVFVRLKG